jgi:membrane-associated protease RseP (regulator of RpoE activity)
MRRLKALLIAAGLAAAPVIAAAGPSMNSWSSPQTIETLEPANTRPRLGVLVMTLTPELRTYFGASDDRGVLVAHVEPGTPAAAAGIEVGDVIVGVRGRTIESGRDVVDALADVNKNDAINVDVMRDKKTVTLQASLSPTAARWNLNGFPPWLRELLGPFAVPPGTMHPTTTLFDGRPVSPHSLHFS